jgi:DNA-binding SARP family transcriptional activator
LLVAPGSKYRLETFGGLALVGGEPRAPSHQRRRLALLALLAASGRRGLSRDQILAFFWPENDASVGRHSLDQLIHRLRRSLGDSIFRGVDPISLNPDVIASDVDEFQQALVDADAAGAVAIYHGPFLSGFYMDGAAEFERWIDTERARLAQLYVGALERLADDATRRADHHGAVAWRRYLVEADPLSSRYALDFMRALARGGDRAAALQHARVHERLVRQDLDASPEPAVVAYAASLRKEIGEPLANAPITTPIIESNTTNGAVAPPEVVPTVTVRRGEPPGRLGRRLAGAVGAIALVLVTVWQPWHRETAPALDPNKVVIVPFRVAAEDSSLGYLRAGAVDLLAALLTGEGGLASIDARTAIATWSRVVGTRVGSIDDARRVARELGAGQALWGSAASLPGGRIAMTANLIRADAGAISPPAFVSGHVDSLLPLVDQFVTKLLLRHANVREQSSAVLLSASLPAVRAYLDGRVAARRASDDRAIESFAGALEIDSTFAAAALELAVSTGRLLRVRACVDTTCHFMSLVPGFRVAESQWRDDLFARAVDLAFRYRQKLHPRDRALLDVLRGENYPRPSSARETVANLYRAVAAAPDRAESQYLLGIALLFQGPAVGVLDSRTRADAAFRAAAHFDAGYLAPLARLVDLAAFDGDSARVRAAADDYLARDTTGPTADYIRWLRAAASSDRESQRRIRMRFSTLDRTTLEQIYSTSQLGGLGLADADSAATILIDGTADPFEKNLSLFRGYLLALNRGRPHEAIRLLRRRRDLESSDDSFLQFVMLAAMFADGDTAPANAAARSRAADLTRDTLGALTPDVFRRVGIALAVQSMWDLQHGDTASASAAARWLRRQSGTGRDFATLPVLTDVTLATLAQRPDAAALRASLDSLTRDGCCGSRGVLAWAPLVLANAYQQSGDDADALRVIRRGIWYWPPRFLSTYLRAEGRLAARLGDRSGAIRAYEHYLALRSDPESELRQDRDRIRDELNRLMGERPSHHDRR